MNVSWPLVEFPQALRKTSVGRENQILSSEIQPTGRYPVVDQGQSFISGYSDAAERVIHEDLPLVIFGDHTRCLKYVDFPFILGADGTKVLKPKEELFDTKFFYHALMSLDIPNRGYNRHYALLKEKKIPRPGIPEQRKISTVLGLVQRAMEESERLLALTTELKKTLLHKLFTESLRGEPQKQTEIGPVPVSWEVKPLEELVEDAAQVNMHSDSLREIRYIDVSSISREFLRIESAANYVLKDAPGRARKEITEGDVIFATVRPTLLRVARIPQEFHDEVCSTAFCVLRDKNKSTLGRFIYYLVQREQFVKQLAAIESGASYPAVTDRQVKLQLVPLPNDEEQLEIAQVLETCDATIGMHASKKLTFSYLFRSLLHQLMTAQIRVEDLDLSELEAEEKE